MTTNEPPAPRQSLGRRSFVVWLVALAALMAYEGFIEPICQRLGINTGIFAFLAFFGYLIVIAITLYWIAVAIRWILTKLFWRVGRRLLLSYVMVGLLPFILMTILMLALGYMIAGVMSHAALRGERQATLTQLEAWSLDYALTGNRPGEALPSLEVYDTKEQPGATLPQWLREKTFSGMVWREGQPALVTSRQFDEGKRSVVFVQPLDEAWAEHLEEKGGMIITYDRGKGYERSKATVHVGGKAENYEIETDKAWEQILRRGFAFNRVIWADPTALTEWDTGITNQKHQLVTFISTPVRNLFRFYFGSASSRYMNFLQGVIVALVVMLAMMYFFAALFAGVLIFSISRAVNRIEKGTKAVERGDFSYRIRMKPQNQLGEMAQSFDRMTESISSLLAGVAEKERLQSEIEIAATIQRNLLPKEGPKMRGVSFSAHFEPTASIGGDYYDLFNLDKSKLAVAIGDVSGHGLSTGLVMAMVKAAISTLVEEGADEKSLFQRLNDLVHRSTERRAFMTLAFTIFDLDRGMIRHTNAGHLYPYLLREGLSAPLSIESPSLPLGVRHDIVTRTVEMDLQEGDTIVYLSDGIIEAQNDEGDPFGFDQLELVLTQQPDRSPGTIRDTILSAVARHSGSRPADDDRTVMVLRFEQLKAAASHEAEAALEAAAV